MDAPNDPKTSTGEMLKRLLEHVLPKGIGEVVLSVKEAGGWMEIGGQFYVCHGQSCRVLLGMGDLPPLMTESL